MIIKSKKFYYQLKRLLVFFLLLNIIVPKCFGNIDTIKDDSVTNLVKNQEMVFYYSSFAVLPYTIVSKMFDMENTGNKSNKKNNKERKKSAEASSEFSLIQNGIKIKITKTKYNCSDNQSASSNNFMDEGLIETEVHRITHSSFVRGNTIKFIVTLPRAGIDNVIIYLNRVV